MNSKCISTKNLIPNAHESGSVGPVSKLVRTDAACTQEHLYPTQCDSAIRASLDRIEKPCLFGSNPHGSRVNTWIPSKLARIQNKACNCMLRKRYLSRVCFLDNFRMTLFLCIFLYNYLTSDKESLENCSCRSIPNLLKKI